MSDESSGKIEDNVREKSTWLRFFFMLVLAACFCIAECVTAAVALFQFFCILFTGDRNDNLVLFGASLSQYLFAVSRYVTYNTDDRPFPFGDWPSSRDATESNDSE